MRNLERVVECKGRKFLIKVEDSADPQEYIKYEALRNEIWECPDDHFCGARNMMCESFRYDGTSMYIGVYAESEGGGFGSQDGRHLVGFAWGYVGIKDKDVAFRSLDNLVFYSQYTGVRRAFQRYGLGVPIKEFQRDVVKNQFGIHTITCTFDPLSGINAYRNVHHFGMDIVDYHIDIYGAFSGRLNRADIPSDRFSTSWDLDRSVDRSEYDLEGLLRQRRTVTDVEPSVVEGKSGPVELEMLRRVDWGIDEDPLLVEIPFDFYKMLWETDVADGSVRSIPLTWRLKTRELFQVLFQKGYRVADFDFLETQGRRRDFYVLAR